MATQNTPMLPGLGGGTGGAQIAPGQLNAGTAPMSLTNISIGAAPTPGAVDTTTPSPKPGSPNVQNAGNPQAPGLTAPGGAVPMGTLPMPTVNEALGMPNMVTDLAAQYGTQATTPNVNSDLAEKMNALHKSVKGTEAPPGNPMRSQGVQDKMDAMGTQPEVDPSAQFIDGLAAMNPVEKSIYDFYTDQFSHPATQATFAEEFTKAFTDTANPAGMPGESLSQEQMQLMNLKNIMDGTEDDIRNEISKAGGFATESQVQALTTARNKTLLKQANVLQQSMALKQDYVDQIMKFTEMDREDVEKAMDRKLGIADKITEMSDKMEKAAKDNYEKIIDKGGFKGLAELMQGNTAAMRAAEKTLGLPQGALQNQAFLDAMKNPAERDVNKQFVSGTANQQSGVFDPATGSFTPTGGGGPSGGGGALGTGDPITSAYQKAFNNAIYGIGPQSKPGVVQTFNQYMAEGDLPGARGYIVRAAMDGMPADIKVPMIGRSQAISSMDDILGLLTALKAKGFDTNIYSGNVEKIAQSLGSTTNPDLAYIGTRIAQALQSYRRSMTGVAFSPGESAEYKKILPDITNTNDLNDVRIAALRDGMNSNNRTSLSPFIGGESNYDALFGAPDSALLPSDTKGSLSSFGGGASSDVPFDALNTSADNFMQVGDKIYKKNADGTYDPIK